MADNTTPEEKNLKAVGLYVEVDRVYTELEQLGYGREDPLKLKDVFKFDSYHYHGCDAVSKCIRTLGISENDKVLDVGSGLGGQARFIASETNCHVTAIELQTALHQAALDLTQRCQLADKVKQVEGDFLETSDEDGTFDHLVSWLVFLHIPDNPNTYKRCYESLKPGGKILGREDSGELVALYIEDFCLLGTPTEEETRWLEEGVCCRGLQNKDDYRKSVEDAGFVNIKLEDQRDSWRDFTAERYKEWTSEENKARQIRVHGENVYNALEYFYRIINSLYTGGNLGGLAITATKPA